MANSDTLYLLAALSGTSDPVIGLEFRRQSNYQLRASIRNDQDTSVDTPWITISDAPHYIEFDWRAAHPAGANNGGITLWVDGVQQADVSGIDNDAWLIDQVQLGALYGVDTGTRGTLYFDAFEARKASLIGP
jgi:hypothetical protein